jgi:hypothetical protein
VIELIFVAVMQRFLLRLPNGCNAMLRALMSLEFAAPKAAASDRMLVAGRGSCTASTCGPSMASKLELAKGGSG